MAGQGMPPTHPQVQREYALLAATTYSDPFHGTDMVFPDFDACLMLQIS
jgi:hypothetical protein